MTEALTDGCEFYEELQSHHLTGPARLVEKTVNNIVARPSTMEDRFEKFDSQVQEAIPGSGDNAELYRAKLVRQCVYAVGYYAVSREAVPRMSARMESKGTLAVQRYDPYVYSIEGHPKTPDPEPYSSALSSAYWLTNTAERFLDRAQRPEHPYHALLERLARTYKRYDEAEAVRYKNRKADPLDMPGRRAYDPTYGWEDDFIAPLVTNVGLGIDIAAAKAMHYVIHENKCPLLNDLHDDLVEHFSTIQWYARGHKHSGSHQAEAEGLLPWLTATGAGRLFSERLVEAQSVDELTAPFLRYRIIRDPDFCPMDSMRGGPISQAGVCAGAISTHIKNGRTRADLERFIRKMELWGEMCQKVINPATIALAVGKTQGKIKFHPALVHYLSCN